jgi:hypothetical protein
MLDSAVGKHVTYMEPPDLIYMRLHGAIEEAEGLELARRHLAFSRGLSGVFMLIDLAGLATITGPARKAIAESSQTIPFHGIYAFGAPLKARVLARLLVTAINLFRSETRILLEFHRSEDEARQAIGGHRERLSPESEVARA